jgi:formylglycine-generating enzyme required for sulfatase activity
MKEHNRPIDNDSLDQLLRNLLLEENTIRLTQKDIDMNAAMLFSAQTVPAVNIGTEKEKNLLNDLESLLGSRKRKGGRWIFPLLLVLTGAAVLFLLMRPSAVPVAGVSGTTPTQTETGTAAVKELPEINPSDETQATFSGDALTDSLAVDTVAVHDSVPAKDIQNRNHSNGNHARMHIPLGYTYEEYPETAPDPVFTAKPSPDDFNVMKGTFSIDTFEVGASMFRSADVSVTATYYEGEPFKGGMNDFQYVNYGAYAKTDDQETLLPWQVMCYADSNDVNVAEQKRNGTSMGYLQLNTIPQKGVQLATGPFYFAKYEVTNAEYREFLQWVRVSNGYGNKPMVKADIDTVPVAEGQPASGETITMKGKTFQIIRKTTVLESNEKVYRYIFFNASDALLAELGAQSLNVYPDSTSWMTDFSFSYNEPMTNIYSWHPAYNDYPVVGISWFQAMAFLDWKTYMHQKQFDAQGVPYAIEYSLPSDIEWELVTMMYRKDGVNAFRFNAACSEGWLTNLGVQYSNDDAYDRPDYLKNLFTKDQYFRGDYIHDRYFHTGPVKLPKNSEMHTGPFDICWLDGNVSEWMMESYAENWKPFFQKHLLAMDIDQRETTQLAKQIEMLYDKGNDANGRLIRGANWYDERFGSRPGSAMNEAGISPRRYIDPKEQHSTVGFRYVVRVRYKDEMQRLQ